MEISEKKHWIIYMYTFPNDKRYIGKTSTSLKDRQGGSNWAGYGHCTVLMRAVKKYGIENIKQEILFEDEMTDEYSSRLEQMCILLFKTNCRRFKNPQYGYNTTDGGEGTIGHRHTEESRRKMSESKIGKKTGKDHPNAKPVYCIELGRVFVSAVEAERYTGISKQTISLCCLGKNKSTRGGATGFDELHWLFEKDRSVELIGRILNESKPRLRASNYSGVSGVYFDKIRQLWCSQITYRGAKRSLGRFVNKNDAIVARLSAEKQYYGNSAPQSHLFNEYNIQ